MSGSDHRSEDSSLSRAIHLKHLHRSFASAQLDADLARVDGEVVAETREVSRKPAVLLHDQSRKLNEELGQSSPLRDDLSGPIVVSVSVFVMRVFVMRVFVMRVFDVRVFDVRVFVMRVFDVRVFDVRVFVMRVRVAVVVRASVEDE